MNDILLKSAISIEEIRNQVCNYFSISLKDCIITPQLGGRFEMIGNRFQIILNVEIENHNDYYIEYDSNLKLYNFKRYNKILENTK